MVLDAVFRDFLLTLNASTSRIVQDKRLLPALLIGFPLSTLAVSFGFGRSLMSSVTFVVTMAVNVIIWSIFGMFIAMLAISKRVEGGGGSRNEIMPCTMVSGLVAALCWLFHIGTIEAIMVSCVCNGLLFMFVRSKGSGAVLPGHGTVCSACGVENCCGGCCV